MNTIMWSPVRSAIRWCGVAAFVFCAQGVAAGQARPGLDGSRNNLEYPSGYQTASEDDAGRFERIGSGPTPLVFIAGWGFGGHIFRDFAGRLGNDYTSYLVTLPGFGGTPGWPMPADSVSHSTTPWIRKGAELIARDMEARSLTNAIVIGHFLVGTHVALDLAQHHPQRVRGLVLIGGELSRFWPLRIDTTGRTPTTPAQRAQSVDQVLVPQFFRFVTDSMWHANNFVPHTFSVDSARAALLWREQAAVPLPIMIRYLSEFYATEFLPKLDSIRARILVVQPGFNARILAARPHWKRLFQDSWEPARTYRNIEFRVMPDAAVTVWLDRPDAFQEAIKEFAQRAR